MPRKKANKPRVMARARTSFLDEIEQFTVSGKGEEFKALKPTPGTVFSAFVSEDGTQGEIDIYGVIGTWELNSDLVKAALREMRGVSEIVVNIDSPGGSAFDGFSIYEALRSHGADIHVNVVGLAASAASAVAMAGNTIEIAETGFFMVHNSWYAVAGDARDLRGYANTLAKIDRALARVYAARTGRTQAAMAEAMDAETWYDAEEAIKAGLADKMRGSTQARAHDVSFFAKAPRVVREASRQRSTPAIEQDAAPAGILAELTRLCATIKGNTHAQPTK